MAGCSDLQYSLHSRAKDMTITIIMIKLKQEMGLECERVNLELILDNVGRQMGCLPLRQTVEVGSYHGVEKLGSNHGVEKLGSHQVAEKLGPKMILRNRGPTMVLLA